jgi:hypothetical protein
MKCPNCGYTVELWAPFETEDQYKYGRFFRLNNTLSRVNDADEHSDMKVEHRTLCGCPKCNSIFLGE